jgi:tetratricopeptide (TPR) repeat protein
MTSAKLSPKSYRLHRGLSLLATILALAFAVPARADTSSMRFDQANRAYAEGHYTRAAADFQAIARTRGWSAPLLYDLGNTYAQEGQVGQSVLNYERALTLAPRAPDIAANLSYVRMKSGLPTPVRPWHRSLARMFSTTTWTMLAMVSLWLAYAGFVAARKWRSRLLVSAAVLAALLGGITTAADVLADQDLNRAVVVQHKSAVVRVSPFDTATGEASLSEGEEVAVVGRHGDFVRVRDGQGRLGWVQSAAVRPIVPRRS